MECLVCGRVWRDTETGYSADDRCRRCRDEEEEDSVGEQQQQYLSTKEAAAYLGVSAQGWHRTATNHGVPSVRYGTGPRARRLYRRADIDRWLESCRQQIEAGVRP